jgi:membrane fusion protein, heavy metal efflux system
MKSYLLTCFLVAIAACSREEPAGDHDHDQAAEFERGPHNGRLLEHEGFALEIAILESGVPPEFRVYLYEDDKPLSASAATVTVKLTRLDGETNEYTFAPESDFLRGSGPVHEPHSFDVEVTAQRPGKDPVRWTYASYEGRTRIADATAESMGVETRPAQPAVLHEHVLLSGTVHADPTRVSEVRARYAGVIREVLVEPSSKVEKGSTLAQIQSNESLQNYPLIAPLSGTLVEHRARVGEATGEAALFTIMDTSRVWVELDVFQKDLALVRPGQAVELLDLDERPVATGTIARMGTLATHGSQSVQARAVIDNATGALRPGQFVTARVSVAEHNVALAVEREAIQKFRDFDVVFEKVGDTYEVRMLELGRSDATHVEVTEGLKAGAQYVARNSYLIKADIEKSGASHDH